MEIRKSTKGWIDYGGPSRKERNDRQDVRIGSVDIARYLDSGQ